MQFTETNFRQVEFSLFSLPLRNKVFVSILVSKYTPRRPCLYFVWDYWLPPKNSIYIAQTTIITSYHVVYVWSNATTLFGPCLVHVQVDFSHILTLFSPRNFSPISLRQITARTVHKMTFFDPGSVLPMKKEFFPGKILRKKDKSTEPNKK